MIVVETTQGQVKGESPKDVAIVLRSKPYRWTLSRIGDLFKCTRENVRLYLKHAPLDTKGYRHYPELEDPATFEGWDDREIAERLGIAESRVNGARRRLGLKKVQPVDILRRRDYFVQVLFGKSVKASKRFPEFFDLLSVCLTEEQKKVASDFYIFGVADSEQRRQHRKWTFEALKLEVKKINLTIQWAIEKEYIERINEE